MRAFISKHHLVIFYSAWLLLQLIQAANTELLDDEAYYWVYSHFLDWGYFDHPPMIALLIKGGYAIFHNELGVRLFIAFLSTATLFIIQLLLPKKNDGLFYMIACSVGLLHIGGILAAPDLPLIFFSALFFLGYKKFLQQATIRNSLLLGLVMALMLYSKYHGILIIFFTFLSNPRLALRYQAWIAAAFGAVLFIPHLYWQYTHGFPSVQFHLFERSASHYEFGRTLEYLGGQLLVTGPLVGWLLLWTAVAYKTAGLFEKALRFSLIGIFIFFLLSTVKGRVEANWTIPMFIPMIILSHQYLLHNTKWRSLLLKTVPFSLALIVLARLHLMLDITPITSRIKKDEFHQNKIWTGAIKQKAGDSPVVFVNSYQKAAKYWFYTGITAFSLNDPKYRRNNYNFWPIESSLLGKQVVAVGGENFDYYTDTLQTKRGKLGCKTIDAFYSFSNVRIHPADPVQLNSGYFTLSGTDITIDSLTRQRLQRSPLKDSTTSIFIYGEGHPPQKINTGISLYQLASLQPATGVRVPVALPSGTYKIKFGLPSSLKYSNTLNSSELTLVVP